MGETSEVADREDRAGLMQTSDLAQRDYQPETRRRLNRNEKKETGWRVPDPKQGKGKVAQAVETFLCNLTRPVEQRDEPLPRKTNKRSEVSNSGQQKEGKKWRMLHPFYLRHQPGSKDEGGGGGDGPLL